MHDEDGVVSEEMAHTLHAASRPKQLGFLRIRYLDSEMFPTAEPAADLLTTVVQVDGNLTDACLPHVLDEIPEKRAIEDRYQWLGQMCCEWTQPTAEAGCQDHGAHRWGLRWGGRRGGPQHGTKLFSLDHLFIQQAPGKTLEIVAPLGQEIAHTRIRLVYDARYLLIDLAGRLLAVFLRGRKATVEKH